MIERSSYSLIVNILITYLSVVNVPGTLLLSRLGREGNNVAAALFGNFGNVAVIVFCFAKKDQCCDPTCGSAPVVVSHDIFLE